MDTEIENKITPLQGTLTFEKAGPLSLVQDEGRIGCQSVGLTPSGAADQYAYHWANKLLNNTPSTPAFEITLGPVSLRFSAPTRIALTGSQTDAFIIHPADGARKKVYPWSSARIPAGGQLHIALPREGVRTYLAVANGFDAPTLFQSCARVPREALPHPFGVAIAEGEQFKYRPLNTEAWQQRNLMTPFTAQPIYQEVLTLPVRPCYQFSRFSDDARQTLFSSVYTVSQLCDRMGYRVSGPKVDFPGELEWSEGIALGSIQIPPNGQPIILLRDRQTIGGYPKIGTIPAESCDWLAQQRPGQTIQFSPVSSS